MLSTTKRIKLAFLKLKAVPDVKTSARIRKPGRRTAAVRVMAARNKRQGESGMKKVQCAVYFDPCGEVEEEIKLCEDCWKVWARQHDGMDEQVSWRFVEDPVSLEELIPFADFVFFDYGGLCLPGHESLGFSFARELEKQIVEHPSVEFILLCTMGTCWYDGHYESEHVNLHLEDVDWHELFDKYIK
jgi:hypothetical protein